MQSLINSLAKVGKRLPFSIRNGFQSHPNSLREMMRIMNLPNPDIETLEHKMVFEFSEHAAQGIAYAYGNTYESIWFLSSQDIISKFVINGPDLYNPRDWGYSKKVYLAELIGTTDLNPEEFDHIGAIDYFEGLLFVPIRCTTNQGNLLLGLSQDLEVVGYSRLPLSASDAFCAITPWNRLLYVGINDRPDCLQLYDVSKFYEILQSRHNWKQPVLIKLLNKEFHLFQQDGVTSSQIPDMQNIAFSKNGRLYITSYHKNSTYDNYLHIYNALTGIHFGTKKYDFPDVGDEIEGLAIHPSGIIYVTVCDWE